MKTKIKSLCCPDVPGCALPKKRCVLQWGGPKLRSSGPRLRRGPRIVPVPLGSSRRHGSCGRVGANPDLVVPQTASPSGHEASPIPTPLWVTIARGAFPSRPSPPASPSTNGPRECPISVEWVGGAGWNRPGVQAIPGTCPEVSWTCAIRGLPTRRFSLVRRL